MLFKFRRQFQVLNALLFREADRRIDSPFDAIVALLEPVILIVGLTLMMAAFGRRNVSPLGGAPILYFATGFFALYLFLYTSRRIRVPAIGRQRMPTEQRLDHIFVRIIIRILEYTMLGFLLFGFIYVFFTEQAEPHDITSIFGASAAALALAFGWINIQVAGNQVFNSSKVWTFTFALVSRSLLFTSGVIYVPDFMSPDVRYYLSFNPMLHAVALFRMGFYPQHPRLLFDPQFLAFSALFAVLVGLIVERLTRRTERSRRNRDAENDTESSDRAHP